MRPREATVAIGVTGHRVLADLPRLKRGVEMAVSRIEEVFRGKRLSVLSALAEGADRLVVEEVLRRPNAHFVVVLPLPAGDYELDFATEQSKEQFRRLLARADDVVELPARETREAAYEAAGDELLELSDVLLAIWDGQDAQGPGGTGVTVARARERRLPIAWVHGGDRRPGTMMPTSLGGEQGIVTFENL